MQKYNILKLMVDLSRLIWGICLQMMCFLTLKSDNHQKKWKVKPFDMENDDQNHDIYDLRPVWEQSDLSGSTKCCLFLRLYLLNTPKVKRCRLTLYSTRFLRNWPSKGILKKNVPFYSTSLIYIDGNDEIITPSFDISPLQYVISSFLSHSSSL